MLKVIWIRSDQILSRSHIFSGKYVDIDKVHFIKSKFNTVKIDLFLLKEGYQFLEQLLTARLLIKFDQFGKYFWILC